MAPTVSVVLPVYRPDPRFFGEAIDSVLNQTFTDLELVIVEDPSDRPGTELVQQRRDRRIRYFLNPERTSLSRQHNRAVRESRGELIARFDADDICERDRIEKQVRFLEEHPDIALVASQVRVVDESGRVIGTRRFLTDPDALRRAFLRSNPISGSNAMFRRSVVEAIGGWEESQARAGLDYEWLSRVVSHGYRVTNHPEFLLRYRLHGEQLKSTRWRASLLTAIRVKRRYWWREMGLLAKLYVAAEVAALAMPTPLIMWIFRKTYMEPVSAQR